MTLEMQTVLEREMDDALKIEDPARKSDAVLTVLSHQMRALIDCQRKTSERVKKIVADDEEMKAKRNGAIFAMRALWCALGAIGGMIIGAVTIYSMVHGGAS